MKQFVYLSAVIFLAFGSVHVWAQEGGPKKPPSQKRTVYDFTEVDILGNVKRPDGALVKERPDTYFKRLFDLDDSFTSNIIRSVEDF